MAHYKGAVCRVCRGQVSEQRGSRRAGHYTEHSAQGQRRWRRDARDRRLPAGRGVPEQTAAQLRRLRGEVVPVA